MIIATLLRYENEVGEEPFNERLYLNSHFVQMAKKFDIALLPLNIVTSLQTVCTLCSGLIIPGSAIDVNPSCYGEPALQQAIDEYAFDRKVIEVFQKKKKPILGVCGGMQELNVYFGGTLKRNVPNHRKVEHEVVFSMDSFLEKIYNSCTISTNSFHSQAVDKVAPSLQIAARAFDDTIEAIQSEDELILGIQWHPEVDFAQSVESNDGTKIFEYFIKKCLAA